MFFLKRAQGERSKIISIVEKIKFDMSLSEEQRKEAKHC